MGGCIGYCIEFQFHIGAIKSTFVIFKSVADLHFNSTLVRLRGTPGKDNRVPFPVFQFHIGAIKSVGFLNR